MSSNKPSIQITSTSTPLPTITPHLMPFHIEHTGSAPLSTYFLVKPVPPEPQPEPGTLVQRVKARFVAAFRGRIMQGLAVDLPEGYSGVVLHSEENSGRRREENEERSNRAIKNRRRSARKNDDMAEDDLGDSTMMMMQSEDETDAEVMKTLRPTAKFSSFTLWNPDVEVDEEVDEYLRFLDEYQRLSAEIHRIP